MRIYDAMITTVIIVPIVSSVIKAFGLNTKVIVSCISMTLMTG